MLILKYFWPQMIAQFVFSMQSLWEWDSKVTNVENILNQLCKQVRKQTQALSSMIYIMFIYRGIYLFFNTSKQATAICMQIWYKLIFTFEFQCYNFILFLQNTWIINDKTLLYILLIFKLHIMFWNFKVH